MLASAAPPTPVMRTVLVATILVVFSHQHGTMAAPVIGGEEVSDTKAMMYLSQYGYLNATLRKFNSDLINENDYTKAIVEFQAFAGLNITGVLDPETKTTMMLPRCGVRDRVGAGSDSRSKRYALQGSRWRVKNLTYRISKYPRGLTHSKVDKELARAFSVWSDYTNLKFEQLKSGNVHIDIRFESGEHGDGDPFDGPGGTLAHAYFPVYGGDAHFDDAETWTIDNYRGTNLFQVAAHEFGHSLGLSHSDVKSALMAPFYRGFEPAFTLDQDDILGIQALYGKKTRGGGSGEASTTLAPRRPSGPSSSEELCKDTKGVDTIFSVDDVHYVFRGKDYYKLREDGIEPGYPKRISDSWRELPGDIDAAFTYRNGKTYFFKGSQYWRYVGKQMDGSYPKPISEGFTGIPDNIDAAVVWSGNGKIYFFKGSKFWKFDPSQRPPVKSTYPKPISNWDGIPNNLDAATVYHGYTYFFKGTQYWRFDDRTFAVDVATPPFPRTTGKWWFGCKGDLLDGSAEGGEELPSSRSHFEGDSQFDGDAVLGNEEPPRDSQFSMNGGARSSSRDAVFVVAAAFLVSYFFTFFFHRTGMHCC